MITKQKTTNVGCQGHFTFEMEKKTMKIYKNNSNSFDVLKMQSLIHEQRFDGDSGTSVILFGDYTYNEEKKIGSFAKAFMFSGTIYNSDDFIKVGDSHYTSKFLTLEKTSNGFERGAFSGDVKLPYQDDVDASNGSYYVMKKETIHVVDMDTNDLWSHRVLPLNFKSLRSIHFCKGCETHYKTRCSCLNKSESSKHGHQTSHTYFVDVDNGIDISSPTSFNYKRTRVQGNGVERKTFIGFEWELGFAKQRYSTKDIELAFYKHVKNKSVSLFNLFGENMEDSTISEHYSKGSEIGSNVMSLDYYKKYQTMIEEVSEHANDSEIYGANLGFHINISRDSFKSYKEIQNLLTLMLSSVEILVKLSGRRDGGHNISQWCRIDLPSSYIDGKISKLNRALTSQEQIKRLAKDIKDGASIGDKYRFLNFNKSKVIEYRLPSSSTDVKDGIFSKTCRHLELVFAMCEYAKCHELSSMRFDSFLEWLSEEDTFSNCYNSIVSNDGVMEDIEQSTLFAKQMTLVQPSLEVDIESDGEVEAMQENFQSYLEDIKKVKQVDEKTKEVKEKHNKNIKQRKQRSV